MTAGAIAGDKEKCLAAGMDAYFSKPIKADTLAAMVGRWVTSVPPTRREESARETTPLLDTRLLAGLRELGSDEFDSLVGLFLTAGASRVAELRMAGSSGDLEAIGRRAHTLKGSSYGLELARRIARDPGIPTPRPRMVLLTSVAGRMGVTMLDPVIAATLSKPLRNSGLLDCLITVMSRTTGRLAEAPTVRSGPDAQQPKNGVAILVAEDNPVNQLIAARMLENLGYLVEVVGDGDQAVRAVERRQFSAVLMDCQMPVMDGFAATAEIRRRQGDRPHLPIIAMTAAAMDEDVQTCLAAGMDAHLAKPVKTAALAAALATALAGSVADDWAKRTPTSNSRPRW
jgi:CheY-like chemotaxis protein